MVEGTTYGDLIMSNQCATCIHSEKRSCIYHGYPESTIPESCEYKIGIYAELAMIDLRGTRLDWWNEVKRNG
jgi:hypothetical protein